MGIYGVIKFQAPFDRMREYDFLAEVKLYKSIILQAIIDASNTSNSQQARKTELEAKNWIFGKSDYFQEVCHRAESHPDHVIRTAKKIIRLNYSNSLVT